MSYIPERWNELGNSKIHAPTDEKTDEDKDLFYENLDKTYNVLKRNASRIVRDANLKIGRDKMHKHITEEVDICKAIIMDEVALAEE